MIVKDWMCCSFCGKSSTEAAVLISGPRVFICDDCIGLCLDILWNEHRGRLLAWCWECGASGWFMGEPPPCDLCGATMSRSEPGQCCPACGSRVCWDADTQTCHAPEHAAATPRKERRE